MDWRGKEALESESHISTQCHVTGLWRRSNQEGLPGGSGAWVDPWRILKEEEEQARQGNGTGKGREVRLAKRKKKRLPFWSLCSPPPFWGPSEHGRDCSELENYISGCLWAEGGGELHEASKGRSIVWEAWPGQRRRVYGALCLQDSTPPPRRPTPQALRQPPRSSLALDLSFVIEAGFSALAGPDVIAEGGGRGRG